MKNNNKNNKKKKINLEKTSEEKRVSNLISAVVLLTIAVVLILGLASAAGPLGQYLALGIKFIFGWSGWFIPIIILFIACLLFKIKDQQIKFTTWISLILLITALAGILNFYFVKSYPELKNYTGGGYFGLAIVWSLTQFFGPWASLVVLLAIFIISLILLSPEFKTTKSSAEEEMAADEDEAQKTEPLGDKEFVPKTLWQKIKENQQKKDLTLKPEKTDRLLVPNTDSLLKKEDLKKSFKTQLIKQSIDIPLDLLDNNSSKPESGDVKANKLTIQKTLENFGISVEMGELKVGPTVTQYTLKPADGVKLSQITALNNDLALALAAHPIRIEAPIPGQSLVGIEVPNQQIAIVRQRELLESEVFKKRRSNLTVTLGKDVAGNVWASDLGKMPHLLVAGTTGSGKTVMLNSIIVSLLYQNSTDDLKFIFIDPKRVELNHYEDLPHLLTPVITDVNKTINALKWAVSEMEQRLNILSEHKKRDIDSYNRDVLVKMPYIVIVVDELADLMVTAPQEIETLIIRLAQMARATGIHLVLTTQKPSVNVITGLIKSNITSRIAFSVASVTDSRTILDFSGAEKLLGRGDLLFISSELSKPKRLQGAYVSEKEIERVVKYLRNIREPAYNNEIVEKQYDKEDLGELVEDELLPDAREAVVQAGRASASLLQRRLRVGYARAARLLDLLEQEGTIGPADGSKPREIIKKNPNSHLDES